MFILNKDPNQNNRKLLEVNRISTLRKTSDKHPSKNNTPEV